MTEYSYIGKSIPSVDAQEKVTGVKAVITAPVIANAIYNVMGVRVNEPPITPEKVLNTLRQKSDLQSRR